MTATFKRVEKADETLVKMIVDAKAALLAKDDTTFEAAAAQFKKDNVAALTALETAADEAFEAARKEASSEKAGEVKKEEVTDEQKSEATAGVLSAMTKAFTPANALFVFEYRVDAAIKALPTEEKDLTEEKVAAFKKEFNAANFELVQGFKQEGKPSAVEYLKDFGLKLLGALLAVISSPVLLFSADARSYVGSFFNGAHTEASRKAQENEADTEKFVTAAPAA